MSKWIGFAVSVNCGDPLGCYQGTILEADGTTITLTKAFRNGFPYPKSQVTLNAADIKELKIIEARAERPEQAHSTVAVAKGGKKAARATVCETLQANPSSSTCAGNQPGQSNTSNNNNKVSSNRSNPAPPRSKPIDIQGPRPIKNNNNNNQTGSFGLQSSTPKGRGTGGGGGQERARRRNEACFGELAEPGLEADFDFEKNLALFDKQALWDQMNNQKPDLVRQTDEATKFRHDENILGGGGAGAAGAGAARRRGIEVPPGLWGAMDYVTDEGALVPAAGAALRRALWAALAREGALDSARAALARGAADVAVRLVGGGRRLEARNAHQAPAVAVLAAGGGGAGAAALQAARLLAEHRVAVTCYVRAGAGPRHPAVSRELALLALCGVRAVERLELLPRPDAVLLALHDVTQLESEPCEAELAWARSVRAGVVCLEPADGGAGADCRAALCLGLPPALAPPLPRLYLVAAGLPPALYQRLGVRYQPPFGASPLLALHPADD